MVVSHRQVSISSNIRAIIEQLNLNPVERLHLVNEKQQRVRVQSSKFEARPRQRLPPGCIDLHVQLHKVAPHFYRTVKFKLKPLCDCVNPIYGQSIVERCYEYKIKQSNSCTRLLNSFYCLLCVGSKERCAHV